MSDSEEFEKWYTAFLIKNRRVPTFYEAYMRSKPEVDALKAELKKLRCDIQAMGGALAEGVWASLLSLDDDIASLDTGISRLVDKLLSLKAENERLRAAPTPPAQEDEPYAYAYESSTGFPSVYFVRMDFFPKSIKEMPLYTRPTNDKLRKAAEGAANALAGFCDDERWKGTWQRERLDNLRAALEGE